MLSPVSFPHRIARSSAMMVATKVKRFLPLFIELHDHTVDFRMPKIKQHLQSLVSADHIAGGLIPNDRFHIAELRYGALQLFVFLFQQSALRLNKYVVTQTTWGEPQVNERAAQLGEVAKKAWPYPTLTEAELAPYNKQDDISPQYTLESYQYLNAFNRMLFEKLNTRILNLGTYVKREFKKLYIAYKADTNFVDVVIQSSRLRLAINMKFADVIDPKGICKDTTGVGRWGNGDVEVGLDSLDGLDDVMAIIEQAFELQDVE